MAAQLAAHQLRPGGCLGLRRGDDGARGERGVVARDRLVALLLGADPRVVAQLGEPLHGRPTDGLVDVVAAEPLDEEVAVRADPGEHARRTGGERRDAALDGAAGDVGDDGEVAGGLLGRGVAAGDRLQRAHHALEDQRVGLRAQVGVGQCDEVADAR